MDTKEKQKAFTLVELLIAMAIALVVIAGISSTFISQRKTYDVQEQISEMLQNGRAAMGIMSNEIRMTGYGAPTTNLSSWITWVSGVTFDSNPKIEDGAGALGSDIIHIAGCFDGQATTLSPMRRRRERRPSLLSQRRRQQIQYDRQKDHQH